MKLVQLVDRIEKILIVILFTTMVVAVFGQVVNRNIFKLNIGWFEEIARFSMIYMLVFATEMGLRDHSQLNVDSLVRRVPKRFQMIMQHISTIVTVIFAIVVCVTSVTIVKAQFESGAITPGLGIPTFISQLAITIGFAFVTITQIVIMINSFKKEGGKK